mgnify:CR=1 FL=1
MAVNIVVAHGLEAKALVKILGLKREKTCSDFLEYGNSNNLRLLVSGVGKVAVAAAVNHLGEQQGLDNGEKRAWLNIGIAGHRNAPLGSGWLGNKITDQRSGSSAYPPQLIDGIQLGSVVTVDEPENSYPLNAAYEMEASAFYTEATKYSTAELVQIFKIISDNLENPLSEIDLQRVPGFIAEQAPQIVSLVEKMSAIVEQYNVSQRMPSQYQDICENFRLTVNQKLQIRRLCQRFKALDQEKELCDLIVLTNTDTSQLIQKLSNHIDQKSEA